MEEVVKKSGRDMPLSAGVKLKSIQRKRLVIYGLGFFFFFYTDLRSALWGVVWDQQRKKCVPCN